MISPTERASIEQALAAAGCITPAEEAEALLRSAGSDPVALEAMLARRIEGEPLPWITGSVRFCDVDVAIAPGVYVPRWQTEALARRATALLPPDGVAVDLCTGSGALALVLAAGAPGARVVATDVDPIAVACARRNGVETFEGSLDEPLPASLRGSVDVLTAVPPYVPTDELRLLPRDVLRYEPRAALDGGSDGTELLAEIVRRSGRWLRPGGTVALELGGDQAATIRRELLASGFDEPEVLRDAEGDPRGVVARHVPD
jgi:release factor glutamine methyltransferase